MDTMISFTAGVLFLFGALMGWVELFVNKQPEYFAMLALVAVSSLTGIDILPVTAALIYGEERFGLISSPLLMLLQALLWLLAHTALPASRVLCSAGQLCRQLLAQHVVRH